MCIYNICSCKSSYSNHLPICQKETLAFRAQQGPKKAQIITFKRHALSCALALFQCSNSMERKIEIRTPHARGFNHVNKDACIYVVRERERERYQYMTVWTVGPTVTSCDTKMFWISLNDLIVNVNALRNVETLWDGFEVNLKSNSSDPTCTPQLHISRCLPKHGWDWHDYITDPTVLASTFNTRFPRL